jgi:hypothetical protein
MLLTKLTVLSPFHGLQATHAYNSVLLSYIDRPAQVMSGPPGGDDDKRRHQAARMKGKDTFASLSLGRPFDSDVRGDFLLHQ